MNQMRRISQIRKHEEKDSEDIRTAQSVDPFSDIEEYGVESRLGELARELKESKLRTASGTTGSDSEETTWQVAGFRHSLPSRPGGAEFGDAGVIADF